MVENMTSCSAEKHQKKNPQLKEKNKVYVHTKNLKNKKPNKKLDAKKVGPFLVK